MIGKMVLRNDNGERVWDMSNEADKKELDELLAKKEDKQKKTYDPNDMRDMKAAKEYSENRLKELEKIVSQHDNSGKTDELEQLKTERDSLKKELDAVKNPPSNAGGTPLNSAQMGLTPQKQGVYPDSESMISDLLTKEKYSQNKAEKSQAKQAIDSIMIKTIRGARQGNQTEFTLSNDVSIIEKINANYRKKVMMARGNSE
jgi:hypothetical protein